MRWPRDNQSDLIAFYGTPGPEVERQLVDVVPPFIMRYEGKPIRAVRFHRKAAAALTAALNEIWEHYGKSQAKIDALGISKYAGAYNPRFIRGSNTKWSNHAYGAAIDLNAEDNGFGAGHGNIPQPVIDAFKRQGARWGGDYHGRTDPMHFEFCDAGAAPVGIADVPLVDSDDVPESNFRDEPVTTPTTASGTAATVARVVGGTVAAGTATSQVISAVTGPISENVEVVKQVIDTGGQVVDVSRQVVTVAPAGFWRNTLAFVQSPKFLAVALAVICIAWAVTYFMRKRHERETS